MIPILLAVLGNLKLENLRVEKLNDLEFETLEIGNLKIEDLEIGNLKMFDRVSNGENSRKTQENIGT